MARRSSHSPARRWAVALAGAVILAANAASAQVQTVNPAEVGSTAPEFTLPDTSGAQVRLSDFTGKAILLTFWSCYTDTCFTTVSVFEELLAKLGPLGLVAPTVCEEIPPGLAADNYAGLLQRCSTGQKILVDAERQVRGSYRIRQLPTSIVIGPDLKILEIVRGIPPLRDPAFHERLEKLVRSLPPQARTPATP